jgi:hypothetical protein
VVTPAVVRIACEGRLGLLWGRRFVCELTREAALRVAEHVRLIDLID